MKKVLQLFFLLPFFFGACNSDDSSANEEEIEEIPGEERVAYELPEKLQDYYEEINFSSYGEELKEDLATLSIAKHTTFLEYWQRHNYLYRADRDPDNPANVILIYSGESRDKREYESSNNTYSPQTFNTEHVYPQSMLDGEAVADLHILRVADSEVNKLRWNYPFTAGSGSYNLIEGNSFYPGDEWRGDVARMLMYMNLRYDEPFSAVGNLDLFVTWNAEDPVSVLEIQRNNVIEEAQGNRNPFIDNPHLATRIWGGETAANRWGDNSPAGIIISEYTEGSRGHNKALEIANPTGEAIDLSGYSLMKISNAEEEWKNEYYLQGTLASGEVFVIVHRQADLQELLDAADVLIEHQIVNFNGNDPIGLFKDGTLIDMIGYMGGEDFAANVNLRRKSTVSSPNPVFTPDEWETYSDENTEGFGNF